MLTESLIQTARDNMTGIIGMNHECSHADFIGGLFNATSVSDAYEHILFTIGADEMFAHFVDDYDCGLGRPIIDRPHSKLSPAYAGDTLNGFENASARYITYSFRLCNVLRYIRASLITMPCDKPIAATLKKLLIDREPMTPEHVSKLPVVLSFPLYALTLMEPTEANQFLYSEAYVCGLAKATNDYNYPDTYQLYRLSRSVVYNAIVALYRLRQIEASEGIPGFENFKAISERFGIAACVDDAKLTDFVSKSYYNTKERHGILNDLFYGTVDAVKRSKDEVLVQLMKSDIDAHVFSTVEVEVEKNVINYLKLLG